MHSSPPASMGCPKKFAHCTRPASAVWLGGQPHTPVLDLYPGASSAGARTGEAPSQAPLRPIPAFGGTKHDLRLRATLAELTDRRREQMKPWPIQRPLPDTHWLHPRGLPAGFPLVLRQCVGFSSSPAAGGLTRHHTGWALVHFSAMVSPC